MPFLKIFAANSTQIFEKRLYLCELFVRTCEPVRACDGIWPVWVYVSRLKETRIEPRKNRMYCLFTLYATAWNIIRWANGNGHAQYCFSFALSLHMHSRAFTFFSLFFSMHLYAEVLLWLPFTNVAVLQANSTLKLSSIACENTILFFLFASFSSCDHYSAFVNMCACARIIVITIIMLIGCYLFFLFK